MTRNKTRGGGARGGEKRAYRRPWRRAPAAALGRSSAPPGETKPDRKRNRKRNRNHKLCQCRTPHLAAPTQSVSMPAFARRSAAGSRPPTPPEIVRVTS
eukprot:2462259-Rhodomonas_salina.2